MKSNRDGRRVGDKFPWNTIQGRTFLEVVPRTREGILGYLSCGSLKGIGPKTAERIVNRFGLDTLEVMEKYPQEF